MLDLATARCEHFAACLNQDFQIVFTDGTLVLQLSDARSRPAPDDGRDPFTLTFRGAPELRLPQGIYKMTNATLGEMEIFLVQVAADETCSTFEAVFS